MKQTKLRWAAGSRRSQAKTPRLPKSFLHGNRSQGGLKSTKDNLKIRRGSKPVSTVLRKSVSIYPRSASENSRRSSLVLTMTHERKGLTILKGAKSCEAKRTTADEESRLPRRFEPVKLQVFPPPPVRTFKRIYRAKIRICHLRKNIIPSPRMILCLRRIDLTRCPADEICKRFLIL